MAGAAQRTRKSSAPPGRWPKRVLAVRVLQAKVAWLDAPLEWRDGRVVWLTEEGEVRPDPSVLARTQRSLHKIRTFPVAAAEAFGDAEAWIAERQRRLELAKRLGRLHEPDLEEMARRARAGDAEAVNRLLPLIPVEALCRSPLPLSPVRVLAGRCRREAIQALVFDDLLPEPARALAALLWAATDREAPLRRSEVPGWVHRAATFGRAEGIPDEPALAVHLLRDPEGTALVYRCREALREGASVGATPELALELLQAEVSPARAVELLEALARLRPVLDRVRHRPPAPPLPEPPRKRNAPGTPTRQERAEWAEALKDAWLRIAQSTQDPASLHLAGEVTGTLLDLPAPTRHTIPFVLQVFAQGLQLPPDRWPAYLRLLTRQGEWLWQPLRVKPEVATERSAGLWRVEFDHVLAQRVRRLAGLVRSAREDLVERVIQAGLLPDVDLGEGDDYLELVLEIASAYCPSQHTLRCIGGVLACYPDTRVGAGMLRQLFRALEGMEPRRRSHLLEEIVDFPPYDAARCRRDLALVLPHLDLLIGHTHFPETECICSYVLHAVVEISLRQPEQARAWLEWLVSWVNSQYAAWEWDKRGAFYRALPFAASLSLGRLERFQALIHAGVRHEFEARRDTAEDGLKLIRDHPLATRVLSDQFIRHPGRCETLLTRLGLVRRFGLNPAELLESLEPRVEDADSLAADPGWRAVLDHTPELLCEAAAYVRAGRILGAEASLPRSLQRILQLPERLRRELKHLKAKRAEEPHRSELAARAETLETRLADPQRLAQSIRGELRETLPILTRDLQLEALEALVDRCYRERLEQLAGPAGGVPLDDDLRNAALLSVDIEHNRKLLRKLLRSHLRGEKEWVREHPANQAFLEKLRAARVNVEQWLGEHRGKYRCPGVKGEYVRLHLERDPIRILQMGNYFDTCLSFGGCNSYSTVTNACELNKRVIYATDSAGRVVGRKLIGINEAGKLIGFHTYTSLPDSASGDRLRQIFRRYARRFARLCGLEMAEQGTLPRLFAEAWYDDGVTPWKDEEEPSVAGRSGTGEPPGSLKDKRTHRGH